MLIVRADNDTSPDTHSIPYKLLYLNTGYHPRLPLFSEMRLIVKLVFQDSPKAVYIVQYQHRADNSYFDLEQPHRPKRPNHFYHPDLAMVSTSNLQGSARYM